MQGIFVLPACGQICPVAFAIVFLVFCCFDLRSAQMVHLLRGGFRLRTIYISIGFDIYGFP